MAWMELGLYMSPPNKYVHSMKNKVAVGGFGRATNYG